MFKQYIQETYIEMSRGLTGEGGKWLGRDKEKRVLVGTHSNKNGRIRLRMRPA